jgi:hypothetical protein
LNQYGFYVDVPRCVESIPIEYRDFVNIVFERIGIEETFVDINSRYPIPKYISSHRRFVEENIKSIDWAYTINFQGIDEKIGSVHPGLDENHDFPRHKPMVLKVYFVKGSTMW